jgi:hypothetical protein
LNLPKEETVMRAALILVLSAALLVGACDDDSPTSPSTAVPTFIAQMTPANEVPPVTNEDVNGRGTATVRLNVVRNASGAITEATADMDVTLTGFPVNTSLTGAHVHAGRAGSNGGIVVDSGIAAGDIVLANGSGSFSRPGRAVPPDVAQNMLNDPAGFYYNVHTTVNRGGAVRAQIVLQ